MVRPKVRLHERFKLSASAKTQVPLAVDKLWLTGRNLGRVFNFRCGGACLTPNTYNLAPSTRQLAPSSVNL